MPRSCTSSRASSSQRSYGCIKLYPVAENKVLDMDFDGDGRPDLAAISGDQVRILRNETP
jgi:hypothetical protein